MNAATSQSSLARFPWRPLIWGGAALLFSIPVVAGIVQPEGFDWSPMDYVFAAVMIFGSALVMELGLRMSGNATYRFGFAVALGTAFFTIWSNLAVGIIGNEDNPLNLMYFAALLLGIVGALAVRFRAAGLGHVTGALAVAQFAIAGIAQFNGYFTWIIAAFFAVLWSASSMLFRKAARTSS